MDYVYARKSSDLIEIVGFHCDLCIVEIKQLDAEFDAFELEGIAEDGMYRLEVVFHPPEFEDGGLVGGSWYEFKILDFDPEQTTGQ